MKNIYKIALGIVLAGAIIGGYFLSIQKHESLVVGGLSTGLERYVGGATGGGLRTLNVDDHLLLGARATTSTAVLEVAGTVQVLSTTTIKKSVSGGVGPELRLDNPADTAADKYLLSIYDGASGSPYRAALQWLLGNTGQGQMDVYGGSGVTVGAMTKIASFLPTGSVQLYGTTTASNIGNLGGVLDSSMFAGAELGAQVNAGYLGAPTIGTNINIPSPSSGSQWSFTTPILAGTAAKPLRLTCAFGGGAGNYGTNGVGLLYTSTTGSAVKFDTGQGSNESGSASGMVNCNLLGTNGTTARTTVGVEFGGVTNGAFTGYLNGVNISGMGTGVKFSGNTSFNFIQNSTINFNGRNLSEPDTGGANCENLRLLGSILADANNQAGGVTDLKGMYVQESGNCQWNNLANSFDDNQIFQDQFGGTANVWSWVANHFENPNVHVYSMLETIPTASNVINNFIGGDMMNDVVAGQPDQIKAAGTVNLIGFTSDANSNVTVPVTRIVNALASTTEINWMGLTCKGANYTSFVYGRVPCSPFGIGSDKGQPSLYVASTTTKGIGIVDIATSTTNMDMAAPSVLNIGLNPTSAASTTVNMKRIQFQGESNTGVVSCAYIVGTAWVIQAGACNN